MLLFLSKIFKNRRLWGVALVLALGIVAMPGIASAQFGLFDIGQAFVSKGVFILTWILSLIAGFVIAIEGWFLSIVLSISFDLVNAAPVRIGFPIVLSMANLFFVGGLIAIAIATILRREEYGMKKVLWKLVVMAVMVNFGLVICGALLRLSDETAKFFLESVTPGGTTDGAPGFSDYKKFADAFSGAFNPQAAILNPSDVTANPALAKEELSGWATTGNKIGDMVKPIVGVLSTLGSFIIIIITLGTLIGMLVWRYIRLGMALIVLPLAWAAWIFPAYQEHYKTWWTKFTKWAIFPPVVIFFIWIGLKMSEIMSKQDGEFKEFYNPEGSSGLSQFLGNLFTPIISQTLKSFILFGIMMGGMVAAQELGVKFADAGYKAIESAGGWAKGKAVNYAKRGGRATGQAMDRGVGRGLGLGKGGVSGWLAGNQKSTILAGAGRGLQALTRKGGADLVEQSKKQSHTANDDERVALLQTAMELPDQLAELSKMNDLSKIKDIGGEKFSAWLLKNHEKIKDYQQHGLEKKLKDLGASHGVLQGLTGKANLEQEVLKAMKDGDPKDLAALLKNNALGLEPAMLKRLQQALVKGVDQSFSPDQFADFTAGLGRAQKENLLAAMNAVINPPGTSPAVAMQNAIRYLGKDKMDVIRNNGPMQDRGFTSDVLWQEPRRQPTNQQPIGGGRKPPPAPAAGQPPATGAKTPAPAPAPNPQAPSGGGSKPPPASPH